MAEWKKVIVSGSDISQLNDDIGIIVNSETGSIAVGGDLTGTVSNAQIAANAVGANELNVTGNGTSGQFLSSDGDGSFTWTNGSVPNDATITLTAGAGLAAIGDGSFTLNQSGGESFTFAVDGVLEDLDTLGAPTTDGQFIVATGAGAFAYESGATARTSLGLGDSATQNTGSMTVANADTAASVAANSVALGTDTTGNYVATITGGTGITSTGATSGEGIAHSLSVDYGSSSGTAVQGNTNITLTQTSGEIDITGTAAQALGGGPSYTIGLADTITGARTFSGAITMSSDLTVAGDLTVSGTVTSLETTNLNVTDQFILLNSGSGAADAGLVVNGASSALGWDNSAGRWSFDHTGATWNQTSITPDTYAAAVVDEGAGQSDAAAYQKNGNIRVTAAGDIYFYA